jgi:hypothetical protein
MKSSTWQELAKIKFANPGSRFIYHYHVPKTGGTSIFANLLQTAGWFPFNTDKPIKAINKELSSCKGYIEGGPYPLNLYGRSHNLANRLLAQSAQKVYDASFCFYRDPLSIQLSNINMIVNRVIRFFGEEYPSGSTLYEWTSEWISELGICQTDIEKPQELAYRLSGSNAYISRYAGILSRYFPERPDELHKFLSDMKMTLFSMKCLDQFQSTVFGIASPVIANKNNAYYLRKDDLPGKTLEELVSMDALVNNSLLNFMVSSLEAVDQSHWIYSFLPEC